MDGVTDEEKRRQFYQMPADDFEARLMEMDVDPETERWHWQQFAKYNGIGQHMPEVGDVGEGRVRSQYLPMSRPEGMSGWDALTSGQAEWAVPEALAEGGEQAVQAVDTMGQLAKGNEMPKGDIEAAAWMGAGAGAVGGAGMAAPTGSLRSFAGQNPPTYGPRDPSKPVISRTPETGVPADFETDMIDPLPDFLGNLKMPKKGAIVGRDVLTQMKKEPSLRDPLIDYSMLSREIDPSKRYTKEELQSLVDKNSYQVRVIDSYRPDEGFGGGGFRDYQRQGDEGQYSSGRYLMDDEKTYHELVITATRNQEGGPTFRPEEEHFGNTALAHTRISVRGGQNKDPFANEDVDSAAELFEGGEDYILVEELQSDLIQGGWDDPAPGVPARPPETSAEARARTKDRFVDEIANLTGDPDIKEPLSNSFDRSLKIREDAVNAPTNLESEDWMDTQKAMAASFSKNLEEMGLPREAISKIERDILEDTDMDGISVTNLIPTYIRSLPNYLRGEDKVRFEMDYPFLENAYYSANTIRPRGQRKAVPERVDPPIKKIKDATDLELKALFSFAEESGINKIVIPPLDRITMARAESSDRFENLKGTFKKTYQDALSKSLKELKANYPEVEIYPKELPYATSRIVSHNPDEALNSLLHHPVMRPIEAYAPSVESWMQDGMTPEFSNLAGLVDGYKMRKELNKQGFTFKDDPNYDNFRQFIQDEFDVNIDEMRTGEAAAQIEEHLLRNQPEPLEMGKTGLVIDISKLREQYDLSKPRFNKGGLVEETDAMLGEAG